MPRPITKKDVARWRTDYNWKLRVITNELGICIKLRRTEWQSIFGEHENWSYSVDRHGEPIWCSKKALIRRVKLGFPKPRKKPRRMKDINIFSMEEMELAQSLMEGLE